jgi:hypothetical protein
MTTATRDLTDADLNEVSGGRPNLGGYVYCNNPGTYEGLYVGSCPQSPITWGDIINVALGR